MYGPCKNYWSYEAILYQMRKTLLAYCMMDASSKPLRKITSVMWGRNHMICKSRELGDSNLFTITSMHTYYIASRVESMCALQ